MRIVTTDKEGLVKRPEDAKAVTLAGELFKFVVKSEETGGAFSLIELTVEPFSPGPPAHRHGNEAVGFWVVEGSLTMHLEERTFITTPGAFTLVPKGVTHSYSNPHRDPAKVHLILIPGGLEAFFAEIGESAPTQSLSTSPIEPAAREKLVERMIAAAPKYGWEFDGPA